MRCLSQRKKSFQALQERRVFLTQRLILDSLLTYFKRQRSVLQRATLRASLWKRRRQLLSLANFFSPVRRHLRRARRRRAARRWWRRILRWTRRRQGRERRQARLRRSQRAVWRTTAA